MARVYCDSALIATITTLSLNGINRHMLSVLASLAALGSGAIESKIINRIFGGIELFMVFFDGGGLSAILVRYL